MRNVKTKDVTETNKRISYLADMKLLDKGRVSKVILVFLWCHVVGSHDVLLEHELLWVLLSLAHYALVRAAISPVVFTNFDRGRAR